MMFKLESYYIATTPETVVSLIEKGEFPDETTLAEYVSPRKIVLHKSFNGAAALLEGALNKGFVVEILFSSMFSQSTQNVSVIKINTDNIKQIIVYSKSAEALLKNLLKRLSKIPAISNLNILSPEKKSKKTIRKKRKISEKSDNKEEKSLGTDNSLKKKLKPEEGSSSITQNNNSPAVQPSSEIFRRLSTVGEHISFLKTVFSQAKESILMATHCAESDSMRSMGLFKLIRDASQRGVSIFVYYHDTKGVEENVLKFFQENNVNLYNRSMRSNILAIDNKIISIGSFDWLYTETEQYNDNCYGTAVYQGKFCYAILNDIRDHIKHYKSKETRKPCDFTAIEYPVDKSTSLTYIPTLYMHCIYLSKLLKRAKKNVIVCAPFIPSKKEFINDFYSEVLRKLSSQKVDLIFVCNKNDKNIKRMQDFSESIDSKNIHLLTVKNLQLKTVVIDNKLILEGSFNPLWAVKDDTSEFHKHFASLVVSGEKAGDMIQHFNDSPIGKAIENYFLKQRSYSDELYDFSTSESLTL